MEQPLISVIVPIYMIDRYLGICIESIINQTYRNLEIILVDDGGRDRCPEICDLYARKDSRIRVIHQSNGGLVSARKAGLQESNGKYTTYVDGDDWIGPGFIEALYTAAVTGKADMVCAGFTRDLFSKSAPFLNGLQAGIYEGEKLQSLWQTMISCGAFYRPGISTYVWNKLFRREILLEAQPLVDNRISIGEDAAVTYPALLLCRRVAVTENVAYHYRQREDSMLKQKSGYAEEARKLRYLYDYLQQWSATTDPKWRITEQVTDYILSIAMMRSGGQLPQHEDSLFTESIDGKNAVIYSAGTFGQQLWHRLSETNRCRIVAWLDDDCWEYRRCCMDVDPVESITGLDFDVVLIATVDSAVAAAIRKRLLDLGVSPAKILPIREPDHKGQTLREYLDPGAIRRAEGNREKRVLSHS